MSQPIDEIDSDNEKKGLSPTNLDSDLDVSEAAGSGGVLSDKEIISELGKSVIIHPYNHGQVSPCSYDVTLGEYYFKPNLINLPKYLHPENGEHIIQYWSVCPDAKKDYGACKAMICDTPDLAAEYGVKMGERIIVIQPGHVILAHTQEFIGGRYNVTTMVKTKSTLGRCGVSTVKCAGFGDVGFYGRYTLEIENHALVPVVLRVGQKISQIVFLRTGEVLNAYHKRGQYQTTDDLDTLIKEWTPLMMVPGKGAAMIREMEKI